MTTFLAVAFVATCGGVIYNIATANDAEANYIQKYGAWGRECTEGKVVRRLRITRITRWETWFQTQLILATCQIRYHSHFGIIVERHSSEP